MADAAIAEQALALHAAWKAGRLGGERMPEDAHPPLDPASDALAAYFTLGMCLNYQRNSYALWRACTAAFEDKAARWVFDPPTVAAAPLAALAAALLHHRVALQPNRHPAIWRANASGLVAHAGGGVRPMFEAANYDLGRVRAFVGERRASFPYLCGPKIANYWLYVMSQYMAWPISGRAALSVAPDRHVIAASERLGLTAAGAAPLAVAERWAAVLDGTGLVPIDLHTPLWLWSRAGFPAFAD